MQGLELLFTLFLSLAKRVGLLILLPFEGTVCVLLLHPSLQHVQCMVSSTSWKRKRHCKENKQVCWDNRSLAADALTLAHFMIIENEIWVENEPWFKGKPKYLMLMDQAKCEAHNMPELTIL